MSFAKLAAEQIVDEEALDEQRSKEKRKKLLLGLAGLAGVAGLGGLAYANRDKIKGLFADKPKEESGVASATYDGAVDLSANPKAMIAGGVGAAVAPGVIKGVKSVARGPLTAEQLLANVKDRNRFPDRQIGGKIHETWVGPVDPNAAAAVGRATGDGKGVANMQQLLEDFHKSNPKATAADFEKWIDSAHGTHLLGRPTGSKKVVPGLLIDKHKILPDVTHFKGVNSYSKWTPGHMAGRGIGGAALTALPAALNWLGGKLVGSGGEQ